MATLWWWGGDHPLSSKSGAWRSEAGPVWAAALRREAGLGTGRQGRVASPAGPTMETAPSPAQTSEREPAADRMAK